jgi:ABC-type transporter lipoprotein component MlaA
MWKLGTVVGGYIVIHPQNNVWNIYSRQTIQSHVSNLFENSHNKEYDILTKLVKDM